jgi:formylglycine-generating enzyme required for sulfatase activity
MGTRFVPISPGSFEMGTPSQESAQNIDEDQHTVRITRAFAMQATDVTQALYAKYTGKHPSKFNGDDLPVERVSYGDAQGFIDQVNARENPGLDCSTWDKAFTTSGCYRLPTEAEWEYAARAGSTTAYFFGKEAAGMGQYAWFAGNSDQQTHAVAKRKPNAWGLYDMYGNVRQWVHDGYEAHLGDATDPEGLSSSESRVFRGGDWNDLAEWMRSAARWHADSNARFPGLGIRLAKTL